MDKRKLFVFAAVVAAIVTTLAALATTISRAIHKISPELARTLKPIFLYEALPAMALGGLVICVAVALSERRMPFAIVLLAAAPIVAWIAGLMMSVLQ
ncbi:MAG TPA: hypothetical protein VEC11_17690 [Allosphingosinicella sp.]|nr:hypothetical protein [Allosphingosinicella sp.]